jgi:hypothetical protein
MWTDGVTRGRGSRRPGSHRTAVDLQAALLGAGLHRPSTADLVVAGVARAHDAVLVHCRDGFDDIALLAPDLRRRRLVAERAIANHR